MNFHAAAYMHVDVHSNLYMGVGPFTLTRIHLVLGIFRGYTPFEWSGGRLRPVIDMRYLSDEFNP